MATRFSTMISTRWLAEKLANNPSNFRLLDASWHKSNTKRNPRKEFAVKHIPGAQFFDISDCRDKSSDIDYMLPTQQHFEDYVGKLGVCNDTHVVVYDNNDSFGLLSAPRVWWTFRTFGHSFVSMLDGGLPKWEREGFDVTDVVDCVQTKMFKANFNPDILTSFEEIENNLKEKSITVLDARPEARFEGTTDEPASKLGHMPNAVNLPYASILDPETKTIKSPEELKKVFNEKGIDLELNTPIAATCGAGISACILALGAHLCGRDDVMVYDGSWREWFQKAKSEQIIFGK